MNAVDRLLFFILAKQYKREKDLASFVLRQTEIDTEQMKCQSQTISPKGSFPLLGTGITIPVTPITGSVAVNQNMQQANHLQLCM